MIAVAAVGSGTVGAGMAAVGSTAVVARLTTALRGALPPSLATPVLFIGTDLSAPARALWSVDGVALSAVAGVGAAYLGGLPLIALIAPVLCVALAAARWRHRR